MKYIPDKLQTHEIKDATLESGDMSKKVIHVNAGAPAKTDDTGLGYEQGTMWVDSTNGDMYICTDHSAENSIWQNMEGDDINNDPFQGENFGFYVSGYGPSGGGDIKEEITKFALSSPHAGSDYGELAVGSSKAGTFTDAAKTKGFVCGGSSPPGDALSEVTTFNFTGSPIGAVDVGNLDQCSNGFGLQAQTPSVGILGGGFCTGDDALLDNIQTFSNGSSPFTASDVCEMGTAVYGTSCSESPTHAYSAGGYPATSNIHHYQKGTTNDSTDVGELTSSGAGDSGGATDGRGGNGFHISGVNTSGTKIDVIQKYPFATTITGSDVGEYTVAADLAGKMISGTTHFFTSHDNGNIYKGSFSSPASTSDVGEVSTTTKYGNGTQY